MSGKVLDPTNQLPEKTQRIVQRTSQGLFWNFLAYGLSKGVLLITLSILARILSKGEFGIVAIAMVAINYLSVIKDLGLGAALIQRRGNIHDVADTVFTFNLVMGLLLSLFIIPLAPFISTYFNDPQVTPVLRWLGVSFFINALGSVHISRLQRDLDFRRKLIPDMGNAIVKGGVSIAMALSGYGVWALVFGQISGALVSVILVWIVMPWRPRLSLNFGLARELIRYGASIMGTDAISITTENFDSIIIGRVFGLTQLGIYGLAYRLPEMLLLSNLWVMGGVLFPAFSSIQEEPSKMRKGFLASVRLIEMIAVPICLGLIIAAHPIIMVLFGEEWLEAVPILRILAIYAWVNSIGYHVGGVYKAMGRPDILLKLSVITLVVIIPALLIGSRFGLIGVAIAQLAAMIIRRVISLVVASKLINVSLSSIFVELKPALMGGVALTIMTLMTLQLTIDLNVLIQLALVVLFGAGSYLGVLWWQERDNLLRVVRILRRSN